MTTLTALPLPDTAEEHRGADSHGTTLEQRLERAWEVAVASRVTECPICEAPMAFEGDRARCRDCGAELY